MKSYAEYTQKNTQNRQNSNQNRHASKI